MDNWRRRENYLFFPFGSIDPGPPRGSRFELKCCGMLRSLCRSKFVWKANCWHEAIVCGIRKKEKKHLYASRPNYLLAKTHFGSVGFLSSYRLLLPFLCGMSVHSFKLGLNIILFIPSTFLILMLFFVLKGACVAVEHCGKIRFESCLNVAESEDECLLQLSVTAGYKS